MRNKFKDLTAVLSFIVSVLKPFKWLVIFQLILCFIWAIDLSLNPYLIKVILNKISSAVEGKRIVELMQPAFFYVLMSGVVALTSQLYDWLALKLYPNLRTYLTSYLMERVLDHSYSFYQKHSIGNLVSKINDIIVGVPTFFKIFTERFFNDFSSLLIAIYTLQFVHPKFAFLLMSWVFFFLFISFRMSAGAKELATHVAEVHSQGFGQIVDILTNITNVRLFGGKRHEIKSLSSVMDHSVEAEQKYDKSFLKIHLFQDISFILFQAVCLWWLIQGVQTAQITPGDFALILAINLSIAECLWNVAKDVRKFSESFGSILQGLRLIQKPTKIQDHPYAKPLIIAKGEIKFESVMFTYKRANLSFSYPTLEIKGGEKVGLVGRSGGGKTTFVNLILRLYDVTKGQILIDGQDIQKVTQDSLRKSIAVVPQEALLFSRSVLENICYGRLNASDTEVMEAAKKADAHEFILSLPNGYQTLIGERGVKLSGGQKQRIIIARALLKNAPIFILDEATSQLDSITEHLIQDHLWNALEGKTTMVIAHRLSTLLHMDRILVFDQGKVIEEGSHQELLKRSKVYATLWKAQKGEKELLTQI